MEAQDCGARLQELGIQVRDLRAREAELDLAMTYQTEVEVTDELIAAFHDEILETIDRGTPAQKKAINRRMFVEVIVDGKVAYPSTVFPRQGFPPSVFDGEAVPLPDVADSRVDEAVVALREFVHDHGRPPTAESRTNASMQPSERTVRRLFGSFRSAILRAGITSPGSSSLSANESQATRRSL